MGGGGARHAPGPQERVRNAFLHAFLPSVGCFRPIRVRRWDAVGYPSNDLRRPWTRPLRLVTMKLARLLVLTLVCALGGAFLAGCGSSSAGGGDNDPAALVPASAPVYVEATVRPDGKVRGDAEAALKKIFKTDDPTAKLRQLVDSSNKPGDVSFEDVDAWVGDKVAVAVTALHNGRDADYAALIASKDDGKAQATIDKQKGDIVKRSYKGVDYRFDKGDRTAAGLVDHHLVVGTEPGLKSVIDVSKGAGNLSDSNGLRAVRDKVAQDRVGLFYVDVQGLLRTISQTASSDPQVGALLGSFSSAAPRTIGAALQAQPDALRVDAVTIGTPQSASTGGSGADIVAGLPADAWLGFGVANLGQTLDKVLQTVSSAGGITGVGFNALLGQFQQQTGLDLRKDVLGWMGDAGIFVEGASTAGLGGALVIKTGDPGKTRKTIAVLERFLRGQSGGTKVSALHGKGIDDGFTARDTSGPPIHVALAGDRFIVAVGSDKVLQDAISPGAQLGSSPAFTAAAGKLGNGLKPSFYLDFTQVTKLIEATAGSNPDFQKAKPYLDAFGAIVAGGKAEGDGVTRSRLAITLR